MCFVENWWLKFWAGMESTVSCWYFPWANHSWKPGWYSPQTVSLRAQSRRVKGGGCICIGKHDFYPSVECSYSSNHSPSFAAPGWFSLPLASGIIRCVSVALSSASRKHILLLVILLNLFTLGRRWGVSPSGPLSLAGRMRLAVHQ